MQQKKQGTIIFVNDERLSRDKASILARLVTSMRQYSDVKTLPGNTNEDTLLKVLEESKFDLVLAPWYRYTAWSRIEAHYGLTRTSGPTFAGYFCTPIMPYELGNQADHLRTIMLDFNNLGIAEINTLLQSLLQDSRRTGIRPLLDLNTKIYCESWFAGQGMGSRMDSIMGLPEIANSEWATRGTSIRICLNALWSLIYDEGPGKGGITQAISTKSPRAYFQVGAGSRCLAMRLSYSMPAWSPKDTLGLFWPDLKHPIAAAQVLLRYADFVRVHTISETLDIEMVAGFFSSRPAERAFGQIHTIWVEPITANLISELPFEAPNSKNLHALPMPATPGANQTKGAGENKSKDRFLVESAIKIRELKNMLSERDEQIRELRTGGVGNSQPLPPPDADALLEAFQERYFEARFQIRQFEIAIAQLERQGGTPEQIEALRQRVMTLTNREQNWIRKIASTLEAYRESKRQTGT